VQFTENEPHKYFLRKYSDVFSYEINDVLAKHEYSFLKKGLCALYRSLLNNEQVSYKDSSKYLYRGVPRVKMENYKVGQKNFWTAFTSTSKTLETAKEFATCEGIIFYIKVAENKPYHNIELAKCDSGYNEQEVLLLPNFYFTVTDV